MRLLQKSEGRRFGWRVMSTIDGGGRELVAEGTVMMGPSREGFGLGVDK